MWLKSTSLRRPLVPLVCLLLVMATFPGAAWAESRPGASGRPPFEPGVPFAEACFDPRLAGVVWDGVRDDSAAMAEAVAIAIREAGTGGACVLLPTGTGVLGDVALPTFPHGLRLIGAGQGATVIRLATSQSSLWVTKADNAPNTHFEAGEFTVVPAGPMREGTTFLLSNVFGVYLHDIAQDGGWNFSRFGTESFEGHVKGVNNVFVERTILRNFRGVVHEFGTGFDAFMEHNQYDTDHCAAVDASCQPISFLIARNWGGLQLGTNDAIHCGNCFVIEPDRPGKEVAWVFVQGAQADTCAGNGWYLHAVAGASIKGFNATQLWGSSCAKDGLLVNEDDNGHVTDINLVQPLLLTNDGAGLHVLRFDGKASITAPTITGNSAHAPGHGSGIWLEQGRGDVTITGGIVGGSSGTNHNQGVNVLVGRGYAGEVRVAGTNLCDGAIGPFSSEGSGLLTITGASCVNPSGTRPMAVGPSPFRFRGAIAPAMFTIMGAVTQVSVAGSVICTGSPCVGRVQPGEPVVVTYDGQPPAMSFSQD